MNEANPIILFNTLNAFQRTGALKAAIELRLFTVLGEGPLEASAVASACNANARGIRILCDYLTVIEFLEKGGESFALTLEFIPNEDRVSPETPAASALTMLMSTGHGDAYTLSDSQRMFETAGFQKSELIEVPKSPSRLVISHIDL